MNEREIHRIFKASIALKGFDALVEFACGLALAFISTQSILHLVSLLTLHELTKDPSDAVANALLQWAQQFSVSTKTFYAFYLASHGLVKLLLVAGLWKEKYWAYPASLWVLGLFIVYQLYRFSHTHGPMLIALTIFDLFVVLMIWHEYRLVRKGRSVR
ncbi:DUF2127 domain-containing protein [Rhizobium sp. L1K21]|uniref:DUF2127 domain-containing protein n=1 Tax=Rhizobium sp. L1K21 TaxID=2954933 RepID=UPI002093708C|nr:DUF2127 domain-containing protein [Rhizobium sp. L1K21]MCO6186712.1 DUF2127 domain-containing protein [Rhizobium sp. L1K21]